MDTILLLRFNLYTLLRHPSFVFALPRISKLVNTLFFKNRLVFFLVALFILKTERNKINTFYYRSGAFKAMTNMHFYKIGTAWGVLKREQSNIQLIQNKFFGLQKLIPAMSFRRNGLLCSVEMRRYDPPSHSQIVDFAYEILSCFQKYGCKQSCLLADFPSLERGAKLAKILFNIPLLEKRINAILSLKWNIGPVHGDFHHNNIMRDINGQALMIDLDSFSTKMIQALDAFTFCVDWIGQTAGIPWQEAVAKILTKNNKLPVMERLDNYFDNDVKYVSILYLINRLGYENMHYGFLSQSVAKEFTILVRLIDEFPEIFI